MENQLLAEPALSAQDFTSAVMDVDYSPTGREFVAGSYDRSVRIFAYNGGHSREVYHTKRMQRVFAVRFSGDASYVFSGSDDMNLRVWKVRLSSSWSESMALQPGVDIHPSGAHTEALSRSVTLLLHKRSTVLAMESSGLRRIPVLALPPWAPDCALYCKMLSAMRHSQGAIPAVCCNCGGADLV